MCALAKWSIILRDYVETDQGSLAIIGQHVGQYVCKPKIRNGAEFAIIGINLCLCMIDTLNGLVVTRDQSRRANLRVLLRLPLKSSSRANLGFPKWALQNPNITYGPLVLTLWKRHITVDLHILCQRGSKSLQMADGSLLKMVKTFEIQL
ncbi:hypothetical protein NE237_031135 [Protea cynaroides]|uniref:Uncharacterized protein n=1 Tax=Protea cynaroides TaxID=273540 RepID=A0A9Q0L0Q6_9MAGN|nr:hypothetical protein NE237_031135 [Protea cynaroides]